MAVWLECYARKWAHKDTYHGTYDYMEATYHIGAIICWDNYEFCDDGADLSIYYNGGLRQRYSGIKFNPEKRKTGKYNPNLYSFAIFKSETGATVLNQPQFTVFVIF